MDRTNPDSRRSSGVERNFKRGSIVSTFFLCAFFLAEQI